MVLANTLSRAYRVPCETKMTASKTLRGETERDVDVINMHNICLSQKLRKLRCKQKKKQTELKAAIRQGWPPQKSEVAVCIHDYFPFTLQNGFIFKGERLVVPTALRDNMLVKLHSSHIGILGCLRRAREVIYWPGMNKDVEDYIAQCETCNNYQREQGK